MVMKTLQDIWDSQIQEQFSPHKLGTRLIGKKLREKGVTLTDDQLAEIEAKLLDLPDDAISIRIDEDQLPAVDLVQLGGNPSVVVCSKGIVRSPSGAPFFSTS